MKDVINEVPVAKGWIIGQPVDDEPNVHIELRMKLEPSTRREKYLFWVFSRISLKY